MKPLHRVASVFLFFLTVIGATKAQVTLTPLQPAVWENESLTFSCISNVTGGTYMYWVYNNSKLRVHFDNSKCTTKTSPLNRSDLYSLRCEASKNFSITIIKVGREQHRDTWKCIVGIKHSDVSTLVVNVPVQSVNTSSPVGNIVQENETLIMFCNTSYSRPVAEVQWFLDKGTPELNKVIDTDAKIEEEYVNTTFENNYDNVLTAVKSKLSYKVHRLINGRKIYCTANNSLKGNVKSEVTTLNITFPPDGPPYIHGIEQKYDIINTFQGHLSCVVKGGNPLPQLEWECFNDGIQNNSHTVDMTVRNITWTASLFHSNTCVCLSTYKEITSRVTIYINVLYAPSPPAIYLHSRIGEILMNTTNVNIFENNSYNVSCLANSNPNSSYSWSGPSSSLSGLLQFHTADKSDAGNYTCTANNTMKQSNGTKDAGTNKTSIYLNIMYPPKQLNLTIQYITQTYHVVQYKASVIENDTFILKCTASGNPEPSCTWSGLSSLSATWELQSVQRSHEGNYTCLANNTMAESTGITIEKQSNKTVYLSIQYPPGDVTISLHCENRMTNVTSQVVHVVENDSVNITCLATSKPESTVYWTGNISSSTSLLEFKTINRNQDGSYTCHASNTMKRIDNHNVTGEKKRSIHLEVLYAPTVHEFDDKTVKEGSDYNISCNVTPGNPNITTFSWTRDGDLTTFDTSILHLANVSRYDNKTYTCTAHNTMRTTAGSERDGNSSASFRLNVLYPTTIVAFFLERFPKNSSVEVNQTNEETLICRVTSNPKSDIALKFGTRMIKKVSQTDEISHSLIFGSCSDAGIYTCSGINSSDSGPSTTTELNIRVRCSPETPLETPFKRNLTSALHVSATFTFIGLAYPEPGVGGYQWNRKTVSDWENVTDGDRFHISSYGVFSNLTVKNVTKEDFGFYKLTVENEMGHLEQLYTLTANGKPDPPSELKVIEDSITDTKATVSWIPGFNGGLEQRFILRYLHEQGSEANITYNDTGQSFMKYQLNGLDSGSTYTLQLFSINSLGHSNSVNTSFTTKDYRKSQEKVVSVEGPVVGGIVSGIIICLGVILGIFLFKRRSSLRKKNEDGTFIYQNVQFPERKVEKKSSAITQKKKETSFQVLQDLDDIPTVYREPTEYYNSPDKIEQIEKIRVSELFQYISDRSEESIGTEYQKLPSGLNKPCTFARKAENIALNRYNGIYPYDHSRVKIHGQSDFFINACYIDGYASPNEYIASLGPVSKVTDNFRTFWIMVWCEQSDIIVMVTNLQEPSGMKCEQYWPDCGRSTLYGDIQVTCNKEDTFAEYTTRSLTVSKVNEQRIVTHLHYTAWPDKKVPEDVTTLIEFRERIKATHSSRKGPMVVHCSAGIGRTGTLIALDRLIEEGQCESAVNVFKCVNSMREQRVKMVQTQEQYIYIYKALVNSLYFDSEIIPVESFQEYVTETNNNMYSQKFQQLKESVEECSKEELDTRLENELLIDKNRRGSDIPGCHNRVLLYLNRQMNESNYINAVYINSLKKRDFFIIAQSPLPETVSDFVCMIYQENCCCVVTMEDLKEPGMTVGQYLPYGDQTLMFGDMQVSCTTLERKPHFTVKEMKIQNGKSERGGKVAYHFQYKKWVTGRDVPSDPKEFIQFIKVVEEYANDLGDDKSHVLVHCLKANERSALFCVVAILMEKMRYERQGSVLNTVRHLRTRRRTAITSTAQLKFCYEAVSAYISMYET